MANTTASNAGLPPLSLYVHIPWCVKKCPYCDFNSHKADATLPVQAYLEALIADINLDTHLAQGRPIQTVFFGGGTPSLFPNWAIKQLLAHIDKTLGFAPNAEITLEANPGTTEYDTFSGLLDAGVNRLSLGVQSFNNTQLQALGRIHTSHNAIDAYQQARAAGFDNINLDLMHGLPQQTLQNGLEDLQQAINLQPEHISWYQLTIEQNTHFYSHTPTLPTEDTLDGIQQQGHDLLNQAGFVRYETSAYCQPGKPSAHNTHYWQFDDYLAIGAGAHGKISFSNNHALEIYRYHKTRLPEHYLNAPTSHPTKTNPYTAKQHAIAQDDLPIEFMMNALRLIDGVDTALFERRTGLNTSYIDATLEQLRTKGLMAHGNQLCTTPLGHQYLNTVLEAFMPA